MEDGVMIIACHPDDAEIGMGGTIAALLAKGVDLTLVDLTDGEPTPHGSLEIRQKESEQASKILGVTRRVNLGIKNREIFDTVENRKKLATVIRQHKPSMIFAPYWEDGHPDHVQASALCDAARFYAKFVKTDMPFEAHYPRKTFYYFCTHIRPKAQPAFVFDISPFIQTKMDAIAAYRSQFLVNEKNKQVLDLVRGESAHWGFQVGVAYGEPFACRENIRLQSHESLLNA